MSSKNPKKDYFPFRVYIDNENFKKFIIFGYKIINEELDKGEKLSINISLYNFVNARSKVLFFTSSQFKKILNNKYKRAKISFPITQIKKMFFYVMNSSFSSDKLKILNNYFIKQSTKDRIKTLKKKNTKKSKQLKIIEIIKIPKKEISNKSKQLNKLKQLNKSKIQDQLKTSKKENVKKAKKENNLKKKIDIDIFVKNTLKKYKKPKPKKKSIWDVIELPKPLVI